MDCSGDISAGKVEETGVFLVQSLKPVSEGCLQPGDCSCHALRLLTVWLQKAPERYHTQAERVMLASPESLSLPDSGVAT